MLMEVKNKGKNICPNLPVGNGSVVLVLLNPIMEAIPVACSVILKTAGDHVILNGSKMWISNAPFSQVAVVWAKNEDGEIQGLIVERGMEGFTTPTTHGKWSLRAQFHR